MKNLLVVAILALGSTVNAQLYVTPTAAESSFVYVDDTFIFVENDVELATNLNVGSENGTANILLRNNAQLLQGEGADRNNKGTGEISIYQEGTVNMFDYNVWASPVGLSRVATTGNMGAARPEGNTAFGFRGGTVDNIIYVPTSVRNSNPAFAIPGYNGTTSGIEGSSQPMLNIASYWLWSFQSGVDYADWIHISNIAELDAGYSFTMKGVSGTDTNEIASEIGQLQNNPGNSQRYDFRGRPNNGDINVAIGPGTDTMVGNPYPSALDLNYFLIENSRDASQAATYAYSYVAPSGETVNATINRQSVINGIAYFWDSNPNVLSHYLVDYQAGYGTYSPVGVLGGTGVSVNAVFYMYDETGTQIPGSDTTADQAEVGTFARRFSPVAQGFFVTGATTQDSDQISFNNRQRVFVKEDGLVSEFRSQQSDEDETNTAVPAIGVATYYPDVNNLRKPSHIKISAGVNDTYSRELAIVFTDDATEGIDIAMDAPTVDNLGTDVGFKIEGQNDYVINAVPRDEYQWIPLTLKSAGTTEFKFFVHHTEEFEYNNVFLLDSLTGIYRPILNEEVLMVLEDGIYEDRFFIRFTRADQAPEDNEEEETTEEEEEETNEEETTEEEQTTEEETIEIAVNEQNPFIDESILESFTIFQNNNNGLLEIYNPENIEVNNVSLFDLTGKQIFNEVDLGGQLEYTFPTRNLATGIYVVKFVTRDGLTKGRKISVVN